MEGELAWRGEGRRERSSWSKGYLSVRQTWMDLPRRGFVIALTLDTGPGRLEGEEGPNVNIQVLKVIFIFTAAILSSAISSHLRC